MSALRELLATIRLAHCAASVRWSQWHVERARQQLAASLNAYDRALADFRAIEPEQRPAVPVYLRRAS